MSSTRYGRRSASSDDHNGTRPAYGKAGSVPLPMPGDIRERLAAFYRERDAADQAAHTSGEQRVRGSIWATALKRLEQGDEVYEPFGVMANAGIELTDEARKIVDKLPEDWRRICRIDPEGGVWTASVKARRRSGGR